MHSLHLETLRVDDASSSNQGPPIVDELVFPVLLYLVSFLSEAERVIAIAATGMAISEIPQSDLRTCHHMQRHQDNAR